MSKLMKPEGYRALLDLKQTELAIKNIKDFFLSGLSTELRLRRVTAPLFVLRGLGLNDDLNGVERPVSFPVKDMNEAVAEVVHSLAKWKRVTLADYQIDPGFGIITDMNAIRPDEELDNIHSLYVDQWDWERVILPQERTIAFLKRIVRKIYSTILRTEFYICETYPQLQHFLPEEVHFIHSEELLRMYPDKTAKEREDLICQKYGAVFVMGIGGKLSNGQEHDMRAPDYDDWDLNGDLLFWLPSLNRALEISSMGIRVDEETIVSQCKAAHCEGRLSLPYHQMIQKKELPYTIGGGIGQSRLCMLLLNKAHVGEVQASIWPDEMIEECEKHNIHLL